FRLVGGLGIGVSSVICPMYVSEIAPSHLRGKLVTYYQLAITIGILMAYYTNSLIQQSTLFHATGGWLHLLFTSEIWRGMFAVGIIPALIFLLMSFLIPESPRWLALKNRQEEADSVLARVGGSAYARTEMMAIQGSLA